MAIFRIVEKLLNLKQEKKLKSIILNSKQIAYMKEVNKKSISEDNKNLKYEILDGFKEALSDKWERLKEETRQACDEMAFLGKDSGFIYARNKHYTDKYNISDSNYRKVLSELEQAGEIVKLYQPAKKCNGRGTPIYLLVNHPMFAYWINYLEIEKKVQKVCEQTHEQTENAEIPCESKVQGNKKIPTFSLPIFNNIIYSVYDDIEFYSSKHNEESVSVLISNFWESTKDYLSKNIFDKVVRKVVDKYNQGKVYSFRDYLATSLTNEINKREVRQLNKIGRKGMNKDKKPSTVVVNKRPEGLFGAWLYT